MAASNGRMGNICGDGYIGGTRRTWACSSLREPPRDPSAGPGGPVGAFRASLWVPPVPKVPVSGARVSKMGAPGTKIEHFGLLFKHFRLSQRPGKYVYTLFGASGCVFLGVSPWRAMGIHFGPTTVATG